MNENHQRINSDSGDVEYYTPQEIVEAARRVMGQIELDPFSSAVANTRVKASRYFALEDDGLNQPWNTPAFWMNHPFGRKTNGPCVRKAEAEYDSGRAICGCCITFAATSEQWFQPLLRRPQCYLSPRTNYYLPDGSLKKGVTKGSVVTYFGIDISVFAREFAGFGVIKIPYVG
jgi:ParB family chromosome partitioning protein